MNKQEIRVVVSGTYSTGKTTTTTALSIATGIPMIHALSAREILTDLYPGRRFQDMNLTELMALGLKRMEERVKAEAMLYHQGGNFISDGSVLNEWIYGTVRMKIGINPGAPMVQQLIKAILGIPVKGFLKKYLTAYGQVVTLHTKQWYTHVIHLPVEFEMNPDGHRPVSEKYRKISDEDMQKEFSKFDIPQYTVRGEQEERVTKIIELLELPLVVPVFEAVKQANEQIASSREAVSKKMIEQYKEPTRKEKISILTKF